MLKTSFSLPEIATATKTRENPGQTPILLLARKASRLSHASQPLRYWDWNVHGSLCLLQAMEKHAVRTFVFSSSATVYCDPVAAPIREDARVAPTNPYGQTKAAVEQMLADLAASDPSWRIARLRYFNPVGAHESGLIGETPQGVPNNLCADAWRWESDNPNCPGNR